MADTAVEPAAAPLEPQAKSVIYCGVCTLPPEYCEFGGTVKKCQEWLEKNHKDLYEKLYSPESAAAALSTLSVSAQAKAEKDSVKKAARAAKAEKEEQHKKATSKVILKRVERNKRKYVIVVSGLEAFNLDLKKVAKEFGKKFACGSSVTKAAAGGEEIVVQGDLSDEIEEFLLEKYKDIPEDNIEMVEDKKKKAPTGGPV
ncbi:translation initiation factor SUI1 [Peziza echinospora]|nr:translation initiation factor SUI1 [Peziza echinospora]